MSKKHKFLDDLSKLFQSAISNVANLGQEARHSLQHKFEEIIHKMDVAHKEELDVVKKLAQKNHKEIEEIKEHLEITTKKAASKTGKEKVKKKTSLSSSKNKKEK